MGINLLQGLHSLAQPGFVRISLSISELHEHGYSHCSFCGVKRVLFTNKLSEYWCHMKPYLFTKSHISKLSSKRVTQPCMPQCNVWAEVVYCGFPTSKVFTKALICLFPVHHQTLYLYIPSFICVCTPVSEIWEFNQKKNKKMNNSENGYFEFDTYSQHGPIC